MTPMVDLGFLLITFFVMTARLSEPSSLSLILPKDDKEHQMPVGDSKTMTVLVNGPGVYYYMGDFNAALAENRVYQTSLAGDHGLRDVIRRKQQELDVAESTIPSKNREAVGRAGLVFLMKAGPLADYKTVIDLMDETLINGITRHMLLSMDAAEMTALENLQ